MYGTRHRDGFLFPRNTDRRDAFSLATCWRALSEDATLVLPRPYDLRHKAASQAVMSGQHLPVDGTILGHRCHRTTTGYARLADAHLVEAAERVGGITEEPTKDPHQ